MCFLLLSQQLRSRTLHYWGRRPAYIRARRSAEGAASAAQHECRRLCGRICSRRRCGQRARHCRRACGLRACTASGAVRSAGIDWSDGNSSPGSERQGWSNVAFCQLVNVLRILGAAARLRGKTAEGLRCKGLSFRSCGNGFQKQLLRVLKVFNVVKVFNCFNVSRFLNLLRL